MSAFARHGISVERFMSFVAPEPNSGCWLWTGGYSGQKQYGAFYFRGRLMGAHRASFLMFQGELSSGDQVLHSCDIHCCVNPEHLRRGTHTDNMKDAAARHRMRSGKHHHTHLRPETVRKGIRHHSARLTEAEVLAIRAMDGTNRRIAAQFGVDRQTVGDIRARKTWRHI